MNKKGVGLFKVLVMIVVIGGGFMFQSDLAKQEQEKQIQMRKEQDRVVEFIRNYVELADGKSVRKVEFIEFQKDSLVGVWWISSRVNNKYIISFSEGIHTKELETSHYSPKEFKVNDRSTKLSNDKENIEVIYYVK